MGRKIDLLHATGVRRLKVSRSLDEFPHAANFFILDSGVEKSFLIASMDAVHVIAAG